MSQLLLQRQRPAIVAGVAASGAGASLMFPGSGGGVRNPGFNSGHVSQRDPDFTTEGLGPNALAERGHLDRVRARSRYLHNNNEIVDGAVGTLVSKVVGRGIGVNPATGSKTIDAKLRMIRDQAFEAVDRERMAGIAESQEEFFTEVLIAGECGVFFPFVEAYNGVAAGPAIEHFASEQVDLGLTGKIPEGEPGAGNSVRQGIEYDQQNRRVAYWVLRENPHDAGVFSMMGLGAWSGVFAATVSQANPAIRRLPISEARLCFRTRATGQLRGIPRITSAMRSLRTEDGYVDTNMLLAQLIASLGVYMEVDRPDLFKKVINGKAQDNLAVDAMGNPVLTLRGGQLIFTPKGCKPEAVNMSGVPGPQFNDVVRMLQRRVSRVFSVGYSQLSGDSSQDNFSSQRGNELDNRDKQEPDQWLIYRGHTYPYYRRCVVAAWVSGRLRLDSKEIGHLAKHGDRMLYNAHAMFDGREYVNPAQEAAADEAQVRTGTQSKFAIMRAAGRDPLQVIREEAEYEQEDARIRQELGVGPRASSAGGGMAGNLNGDKRPQGGDDDEDESKTDPRPGKPGKGDDARGVYAPGEVRVTDAGVQFMHAAMQLEMAGNASGGRV